MTTSTPERRARPRLGEFIRKHQPQIVASWTEHIRCLSPARELSDGAIVDHLPQILERVAYLIERAEEGAAARLGELPRIHAVDRLGRGFDFDQIVTEFSVLRRAILNRWEREIGDVINVQELRNLDHALDEAISQSALRYAEAREKLLKALDRVSEAALGSADLESFLQHLLRATLDGTESVDTCVVLLREGDSLRVRAAVGLEEELEQRFTLKIGEGFSGRVAADAAPVLLRHAARDELVKSDIVRSKGVRALYGVPLMRDTKVIGVAHMGSLTAFEFSEEDKLLFRTMVSRATSGVVKAQILADLQRAETAQRFLAEASKELSESLDYENTLPKIARLAVPTVADWCVVDLVQDDAIRRVSVAHADPGKEKLALDLGHRYPAELHGTGGVARVLRTGVTEWRAEFPEAELGAAARDSGHLKMLQALGVKSYIIAPILTRDECVGTISLVTAESRRRYSEADVRLAEELARRVGMAIDNARLYAAAQRAVAVRERVLAIVSHDLRNQLNVVAGNATLLGRKIPANAGTEIEKPVEAIQRTTSNMQHLVSDLLDMASIQSGSWAFDAEPTELKPILVESYDSHEPVASAKGVRLRLDAVGERLMVHGDRNRILQLLTNLLGNAIKFCDRGDEVTLRAEPRERDGVVAVRDTGPGIPHNELDAIFDPYRSIERRGKGGTGLGLSISKAIVERHGGRIWVESEPGEGTTFFFTLPLA